MASFVLEEKYEYQVGEEVQVYLEDREPIGTAKVKEIKKTGVWDIKREICTPHNQVYFELKEPLNDKKIYTPYFSGMNGRVCVVDEVKNKERQAKELKRKIRLVSSQDVPYKYACLSCNTVVSSSKEFKKVSCKHCRHGKMIRV